MACEDVIYINVGRCNSWVSDLSFEWACENCLLCRRSDVLQQQRKCNMNNKRFCVWRCESCWKMLDWFCFWALFVCWLCKVNQSVWVCDRSSAQVMELSKGLSVGVFFWNGISVGWVWLSVIIWTWRSQRKLIAIGKVLWVLCRVNVWRSTWWKKGLLFLYMWRRVCWRIRRVQWTRVLFWIIRDVYMIGFVNDNGIGWELHWLSEVGLRFDCCSALRFFWIEIIRMMLQVCFCFLSDEEINLLPCTIRYFFMMRCW